MKNKFLLVVTVIVAVAASLGLIISDKFINLISATTLVVGWAALCSLAEENKTKMMVIAIFFVAGFAIHLLDAEAWYWLCGFWFIYFVKAWEEKQGVFLFLLHMCYYFEFDLKLIMIALVIVHFCSSSILAKVKA